MVTLVAAVEKLEMVSSWLWTVLMNMDDTNISPSNWKYGHYLTWDCKEMKSEACLARKASSVGAHRVQFSSVQSLSRVWLFVTPRTSVHQASLSFTVSGNLLKHMSMESVRPSNHLILCHPLLLPPSIISSIRVSSNESALRIRWPKYWSFSLSISPSNEYSGLISFRMD